MKHSDAGKPKSYVDALRVLEHSVKYLENVGYDKDVLDSARKVLAFLRTRPASQVEEILAAKTTKPKPAVSDKLEMSEAEILALSSDQVKSLIASDEATRQLLERVAEVRFGMTKGGLSVLRTRAALVDKLGILASDEDTHRAILSAAQSGSPRAKE